jgi:UDP-4-amino-4,6-dideoxy-N-acetyl-beta-L-altrosamine transaminase
VEQSTSGVIYPYGHQSIGDDDIEAVVKVLSGDWLTQGPAVREFERTVSDYAGAAHAVAFSSGTAALHGAMYAAGIKEGEAALIPPITFAATGNAAIYRGGRPVFADISPDTLCMSPESAALALENSGGRVRVIAPVSYAGYPVDMEPFRALARKNNAVLIEDGAHALGAERNGRRAGRDADMTVFSFHPVKHVTTAEGGMALTDSDEYAARLRLFRNHGIVKSPGEFVREYDGPWDNDMIDLGYNYRLPDVLCALGTSQMKRLDAFLARRREIARLYREALSGVGEITLPPDCPGHAYHLFPIQVRAERRKDVFERLRAAGIGVQVHYVPLHLHTYYRKNFGTKEGDCPVAEAFSKREISLPIYFDLPDEGVKYVADCLKEGFYYD